MYQMKYKLNVSHPRAYACLQNRQVLHQEVQRLFGSARKDRDVLYCVYEGKSEIYVYIRANDMPVYLASDLLVPAGSVQSLRTDFPVGTRLQFYVVCNPVRRHQGRIVGFADDHAAQLAWFAEQSEKYGFRLLACTPLDHYDVLKVKKTASGDSFSVNAVTFTGVLQVTDSDMFSTILSRGFGRERAYGMGMMLYYEC